MWTLSSFVVLVTLAAYSHTATIPPPSAGSGVLSPFLGMFPPQTTAAPGTIQTTPASGTGTGTGTGTATGGMDFNSMLNFLNNNIYATTTASPSAGTGTGAGSTGTGLTSSGSGSGSFMDTLMASMGGSTSTGGSTSGGTLSGSTGGSGSLDIASLLSGSSGSSPLANMVMSPTTPPPGGLTVGGSIGASSDPFASNTVTGSSPLGPTSGPSLLDSIMNGGLNPLSNQNTSPPAPQPPRRGMNMQQLMNIILIMSLLGGEM